VYHVKYGSGKLQKLSKACKGNGDDLLDNLQLAKKARVMLTRNLDWSMVLLAQLPIFSIAFL